MGSSASTNGQDPTFIEQTTGSDDVNDEPCNAGEHIQNSIRKGKQLFECEIIPASTTFIMVKCKKCEVYVSSCDRNVTFKDSACLVFGRSQCEHKVAFCLIISLVNGLKIGKKEHIDNLDKTTVYCKSSVTNSLYCTETYSSRINVIEVKAHNSKSVLVSNMLFRTTGCCYGITCFDGGFALLIRVDSAFGLPPWQIQYVDLSGNIKRHIYRKPDGGAMFTKPTHVTSSYKETILYVIDNNSVLVFDVKGGMMQLITLWDLNPTYIASDPEGNIYVACGIQLLQFNSNYDKRVLLASKPFLENIEAVAWIDSSKCLAIVRDHYLLIYRMVP